MEVVDDQHQRLAVPLELPDEAGHRRFTVELGAWCHGVGTRGIRVQRSVNGVNDGQPEALRVALAPPHGRERHTTRGHLAPGAQQVRLAAPGRRRDDRHPSGGAAFEQLDQRGALHEPELSAWPLAIRVGHWHR